MSETDKLQARIAELEIQLAEANARSHDRLQAGITAVCALINESDGVAGLHLNGDIATWEELLQGGRFEGWLADFSAAL